ncbi:uncharacterized protein LTR77_008217 [Saxophila tyrrhenica]|uniref:Zn(2)-C6 fungal-type domain-containing protein n=1 Tax=Saxophila tyrrhenica TaxID=1690608 RepID=A0AAV9P566_9PEZI|nr:hypothetical protein LTR77_008217 [Saxophila tyrrhenica]
MDSTTEPPANDASAKRKRSPSASQPPTAPAAKVSKTANQLSINYLARQSQEDLPLIKKEESLPDLLHLLSQYSNILDRHESLASNLGARPLGPILIKRFERCFDAPPKVVASHHKGAASNPEESPHQITWLEVIEFARSHPAQFTLSTFSEGKRVCQFYYPQKQLRVQVSEEDFLFINSGRCQELIPPLPIWEDEEKEVATCDVLETKLKELTNAADMVAARTRQLSHRLKGRRAAILDRRAEGGSGTPAKATAQQTTTAPLSTGTPSFTSVNLINGSAPAETVEPVLSSSSNVRSELLRHFESLPHNQNQGRTQPRNQSTAAPTAAQPTTEQENGAASNASSLSPVPPNAFATDFMSYYTTDTPSASRPPASTAPQRPPSSSGQQAYAAGSAGKHNFSRPLPPALESSQPFRPLCQAHMDALPRGTRVMPPCDRCRRLRMDCVKNLTSCAGCTRKHARCHWRDVSREELGELDHLMESAYTATASSPTNGMALAPANGYSHAGSELDDAPHDESDDDDSNPLEDLEALEEKEDRESEAAAERMREDEEDLRQAREKEDEEGLRQARELARQGWEESLRSHQGGQEPEGSDAAAPTHYPEGVAIAAYTQPASDTATTHGDAATSPQLHDSIVPVNAKPTLPAQNGVPEATPFAPQEVAQLPTAAMLHDQPDAKPHILTADDQPGGHGQMGLSGHVVSDQPTPPSKNTGFRAVNDSTSAMS